MICLINTEKPPLDNKLVRQAISYAVPYDDIVNYVMSGYAEQSENNSKSFMGAQSDLFQFNYDLIKPENFLKKRAMKMVSKLLLTYKSGDENERKASELLKSELKKLNIDLEIRGMPGTLGNGQVCRS